MGILDLLKENYLFEDEDNPVVDLSQEMNVTSGSDKEVPINREFVVKLTNYLDKLLTLEFGTTDNNIYNEIRKFCDERDPKVVKKIKERIHKIILDEKRKYLKRIQTKMEMLKVPKKNV